MQMVQVSAADWGGGQDGKAGKTRGRIRQFWGTEPWVLNAAETIKITKNDVSDLTALADSDSGLVMFWVVIAFSVASDTNMRIK